MDSLSLSLSHTVTVTIGGDAIVEANETFTITLGDVTNTSAVQNSAITTGAVSNGTIINDDIATLFINDVLLQEGDLGVSPFAFNITLNRIVDHDFTVDFATEDLSATAAADYSAFSGTLMFESGSTSATLMVDVTGDQTIEDSESFVLRLSNISDPSVVFSGGGSTIGGVATVINDDFEEPLPNGNSSPYLLNPLTDVELAVGKLLNLTVPSDTFFDENSGDTLALSAFIDNGDPLPAWLSFDSETNTLSGTPGLSDISDYNVHVVADDGHLGTSKASFEISVTAAATPDQLTVTNPAADSTAVDQTPTIHWTDDSNVSQFDLSIVELGTGQEVLRNKTLTTNTFTPPSNLAEGDYDVRVRGKNVNGVYGAWNNPHYFTISIGTPAQPASLTPTGIGNDSTPTFTWTQDVNTDNVEISIVDTSTGLEVVREKNIQVESFTLTTQLPADDYHFNMQAWNSLGVRSGWTASISFTVDLSVPTAAPVISNPASGTTNDATPTFTWSSVANAVHYNLVVTDTSNSTEIINQVGLTSTSFTPDTPIANGNYSVVVTGTNEAGAAGASSTAVEFTINVGQVERPSIVAPGSITPNARPTFAWTTVTDVVEYQLWLTNNTTSASPYMRLVGLTDTHATATVDLTPGDYSVWVKSIDINGIHNWSFEHNFTVSFDVAAEEADSSPQLHDRAPGQDAESHALSKSTELLAVNDLSRAIQRLVVLPTEEAAVAKASTDEPTDDDSAREQQQIEANHAAESYTDDGFELLDSMLAEAIVHSEMDDFFAQDHLVAELMA